MMRKPERAHHHANHTDPEPVPTPALAAIKIKASYKQYNARKVREGQTTGGTMTPTSYGAPYTPTSGQGAALTPVFGAGATLSAALVANSDASVDSCHTTSSTAATLTTCLTVWALGSRQREMTLLTSSSAKTGPVSPITCSSTMRAISSSSLTFGATSAKSSSPLLSKKYIGYVPIPRVQYTDDSSDLVVENLTLQGRNLF
ncbi:hypothetical protein CVT24_002115 [Panaeolus cyanescens]|uniref:HAM1-like N-terminal domain-containing protein n=1 Tax=Panaeolus cyanescens TaxID=181874 RepID=A0A409YI59_9AGAR|nr:hypothetical protein CVT24_002115 [Panaeolus cyanescens]